MKTGTLSQLFILLALYILSGCKFEFGGGDGNAVNESGNNCSCCFVPYMDGQTCYKCTQRSWTKETNETCMEAHKRQFGADIYCCNQSSLLFDEFEKDVLELISKANLETEILLASTENVTIPAKTDIISTKYSGSCEEICNDPENPYCLEVNSQSTDNMFQKLSDLGRLFYNSKDSIDKNKIMEIFEVNSDPCERSNTIIGDQEIINSGKDCIFNTSVNISQGRERLLTFYMPKEIKGEYIKSDQGMSLNFNKTNNSCYLEINNSTLNNDFGGNVSSINLDKKRFTIGTVNGCISLKK